MSIDTNTTKQLAERIRKAFIDCSLATRANMILCVRDISFEEALAATIQASSDAYKVECVRCGEKYIARPRTNICKACSLEVGGPFPIVDPEISVGDTVKCNKTKATGYVCGPVGIDKRSPKKFRVQWQNRSTSLQLPSDVTVISQ